MYSASLKEELGLPGTPVFPTNASGISCTGGVDMSKANRCMFVGTVGVLASANSRVDFWLLHSSLLSAAASSGTAVTGGTITQIAASNKVFTDEIRADQVTTRYVYGVLNRSVAEAFASVIPITAVPRYAPNNNNDVGLVTERVVV